MQKMFNDMCFLIVLLFMIVGCSDLLDLQKIKDPQDSQGPQGIKGVEGKEGLPGVSQAFQGKMVRTGMLVLHC
ncbi:hypothetical protein BOFE_08720 (plasmid) [Candidatus Borrelia fainii]|uniref:Collagen-like protein n=1 Tax=Candidatus Borrelia fainii TaxID=2518322 RepID=A0ABM8DLD6_9SPIR|nr:hypothetical protein [Candidatus Borrelia fainii]BDU63332.1 hypothetical protein BOFE_08720 [Candidatus Borrelia fainii]